MSFVIPTEDKAAFSCVILLKNNAYSRVFWRFRTKIIVKAHVNEKMYVFTPELWQFVCPIFGRDWLKNL